MKMYHQSECHQSVCHEYVFFLFITYKNAKAALRATRKKKEEINEEDYDKISLPDIDNNNFDLLPYDKNLTGKIEFKILGPAWIQSKEGIVTYKKEWQTYYDYDETTG